MTLKLLFFPLALIVSVTILIWVAKPEWENLKASKASLEELTQKKDKLEGNQQNLQKALKQFETLEQADRQLIMNAIPLGANNDDFIAEVFKNAQASGSFLVSSDLKKGQNSSDETAYAKCLQEQTAIAQEATQATALDDSAEQAVPAVAYCPPAKKTTTANINSVGSFGNVKDFAKMIDAQNRLSVPSKLTIAKLSSGSSAAGVEMDNNMLQSSITFDFFDKEQDEKIMLSSLVDGNDKILNSLMQGAVNTQAITAFKNAITTEIFRPVTVETMGKADIFAD